MNYRCPLCRQALLAQNGGLACEQGHRFDRARHPGDGQAMARARRAFLAAGHYDALVTNLARQIHTHAGVASSFELPFFDHAFDLVLNSYAPASELRRVLALQRLHTPIDFAIDRYRPLS